MPFQVSTKWSFSSGYKSHGIYVKILDATSHNISDVTYGNRPFRKAARTLWNNLTLIIRYGPLYFEEEGKTILFISAYLV